MNTDIVYFSDKESEFVKKEHVCLNNFEPSPFTDEKGQKFISVEHYYQCHKFDNIADGEEFKKAFESGKPCIVDARVDIDEMIYPMAIPGKPLDTMFMEGMGN